MVTTKILTSRRHVFAVYLTSVSRDSPARIVLHGKTLPRLAGCLGQVDRVPRVGGLPCLACKRFEAFSKETYEKLALPDQLDLRPIRFRKSEIGTISESILDFSL